MKDYYQILGVAEAADDLGGDLGIDFDPDATPSESVESVDSESASAESENATV